MDNVKDYSGISIGKYLLVKKLGYGNFGAVYRVVDRVLKTEKKAIKILTVSKPEEAKNAFNEAAIPYKCKHKNIVSINNADLLKYNDETLFIIDMEYVTGGSLDDLICKKFIPVTTGLDIITNVLYGLEHAHSNEVIHRDIKPANILFDNKNPLISDFGLSTIINTVNPGDWYTTHAAPECFKRDPIATVETDIYALGLTMFRLINDIKDWDLLVRSMPNIDIMLRNGRLIDNLCFNPYVPERVIRIIKKACNSHPLSRYRSASQMRNDLQKLKHNFSWIQISSNIWRGQNNKGELRELMLKKSKSQVEFIMKRNNRRFNNECKMFKTDTEAVNFMNDYIRKTTLS